MFSFDHTHLAEELLPIVLKAGAVQMAYFASGVPAHRKADRSPVTAADKEAEALIVEGLAAIAPRIPVIAEELAAAGQAPLPGDTFFLVDPLDGTREFLRNGREFTINVGLVSAGDPVFGLIFAPALGRLFVTTSRTSAIEAEIPPSRAPASLGKSHTVPLHARSPDPMALVALASRSRPPPELDTLLANHKIASLRRAASSLKFGLLAAGEADVFVQLGETREWDTAAGEAILNAAGGVVTTLEGQRLPYGRADKGFINPPFLAWGRGPRTPW